MSDDKNPGIPEQIKEIQFASDLPPFEPDINKYLPYLEEIEISEEEKTEFIRILFYILWRLINSGFKGNMGIHLVEAFYKAAVQKEGVISCEVKSGRHKKSKKKKPSEHAVIYERIYDPKLHKLYEPKLNKNDNKDNKDNEP